MKNNKGGISFGMVMIVFALACITGGETMRQKGHWGVDGDQAVKNCPGTHVNDNCAHMKISDL